MKPNLPECRKFLQRWKPEGPWVLTAICSKNDDVADKASGGKTETRTFTKEQIGEAEGWILEHQLRERNVYFSVNSLLRPVRKKALREDVKTVDWLHVDIDPRPGKDLAEEQERIKALLSDPPGLPKPTIVAFSGGGCQAFWRLEEPLEINGTPARYERAKLYNLQIENLLGGDGCSNVDRIMRLPGTVNFPNEKKRKKGREPAMAEVLEWNDVAYPIRSFTPAPKVQDGITEGGGGYEVQISGNISRISDLDELPRDVSDRCKTAIVQGRDDDAPLEGDNSRSEWLFYVVCELVRAQVPDEMIYSIITDPDFKISESVLDKGSSQAVERYAIRQIRRAKEQKEDPILRELNEQYAFIESVGGKCKVVKESGGDRPDVEYLTVEGFIRTYSNLEMQVGTGLRKVGIWWVEHPMRRTYERVDFAPGRDSNGILNLWRGFSVAPHPGECNLFLDHCRDVLCQENPEYFDYLVGWMANAVQRPGEPGQIAVVFRGRQGTGKGTFAKHFGSLFGCHFKHLTNPDHILGKFNSTLRDAVVVFADEAFYAGNHRHESALKALITEDRMMVEQKGVDPIEGRNCIHLIIASNEDWVVPARWDDRRFFILETSNSKRRDGEYFSAIQRQMDDGGREALLHYLMTYDLSEFDLRKPPQTEELRSQQMASITPEQSWWLQKLQDGKPLPVSAGWQKNVMKDALLDDFVAHLRGARDSRHASRIRLAKFMEAVCPDLETKQLSKPMEYTDSNGRIHERQRPWVFVLPSLDACRSAWDERFGVQNWPEVMALEEGDEDDGPDPF